MDLQNTENEHCQLATTITSEYWLVTISFLLLVVVTTG
jgi:hypothetical protein